MSAKHFSGTHTALVTPFRKGEVDYEALGSLVDFQIAGGVSGIVAVGTTGESPTLSNEEHLEVIREVVLAARGRVPVLAGTGSNATAEAVELTRLSEEAGADGFLLVAPYYNKPNQEGLFQHFDRIAATTSRPILLYSIPSRCGIEIDVPTVARLYEKHPHVAGIKESGGRAEKVTALRQCLGRDFALISGDDALTLPFMAVGATGVVSVASNLVPGPVSRMVRLALGNDFHGAGEIHHAYAPLFEGLFLETNPVPIKYLLSVAGLLPDAEVRLPLVPPSEETRSRLDRLLASLPLTVSSVADHA